MGLPGWSFLVAGLGIGLVSLKLVLDGQKMGIFLFIGIGMLVYGLVKTVMERRTARAKDDHEPLVHAQHGHQNAHHAASGGHSQDHPAHRTHASEIPRNCSVCGAKNNPRANYCGHCGNKIRT